MRVIHYMTFRDDDLVENAYYTSEYFYVPKLGVVICKEEELGGTKYRVYQPKGVPEAAKEGNELEIDGSKLDEIIENAKKWEKVNDEVESGFDYLDKIVSDDRKKRNPNPAWPTLG